MPKRKQNMNERDKINYILSRVRNVLSMRFIPIQSYAAASSKSDVIRNYMLLKVEREPIEDSLHLFEQVVAMLCAVRGEFANLNSPIAENNLFFEVLFWGLSIVFENSADQFSALDARKIANDILMCSMILAFGKIYLLKRMNSRWYFSPLEVIIINPS